jgi:hypothetical protein
METLLKRSEYGYTNQSYNSMNQQYDYLYPINLIISFETKQTFIVDTMYSNIEVDDSHINFDIKKIYEQYVLDVVSNNKCTYKSFNYDSNTQESSKTLTFNHCFIFGFQNNDDYEKYISSLISYPLFKNIKFLLKMRKICCRELCDVYHEILKNKLPKIDKDANGINLY